jgi:hypothetical protein
MPAVFPLSADDRTDTGATLDSVAVKAMVRVCKAWRSTAPEAAKLFGVSERTWSRMRAGEWVGILTDDQKYRASGVIGLYKGLHLYFSDDLADRWPKLRNRGPLFEGETPVEFMIKGGIPAILTVREYVDAIRGGM